MSENSTPEERTEMPTGKRMGQLRKQGQIFFSQDVAQVAAMIAGFEVMRRVWGWLFHNLQLVFTLSFGYIRQREPFSTTKMFNVVAEMFLLVSAPVLITCVVVATVASLAVLLQTDWNIKERKIEFKILHLNPLAGFKKMVSLQAIITTLKALVKLLIILPIGYFALKGFAPQMVKLIHMSMFDVFRFTGDALASVFWKIMYVLIAIALFDFGWGKYQWLRHNKMTKTEVKDELKAQEGDEASKMTMRRKGRERLMARIQMSVPKADVIITNPTHFAIALQYERGEMSAPKVVAKGVDHLALKIREIARAHGVPIVERRTLARALYESCAVGAEVPYELFRAVAEVLAYVYKLKGRTVRVNSARGGGVRPPVGSGNAQVTR